MPGWGWGGGGHNLVVSKRGVYWYSADFKESHIHIDFISNVLAKYEKECDKGPLFCNFILKLQVCLSMCDLLVDIRH